MTIKIHSFPFLASLRIHNSHTKSDETSEACENETQHTHMHKDLNEHVALDVKKKMFLEHSPISSGWIQFRDSVFFHQSIKK